MPGALTQSRAIYVSLARWRSRLLFPGAFMILWLTTLPLTLAESMGWVTVVICFIVAFAVLGIDAMAVEIENPFGHDFNDLPLGESQFLLGLRLCKLPESSGVSARALPILIAEGWGDSCMHVSLECGGSLSN